MLGHIADKPVGQLIGEIHNPEVAVYVATEFREKLLEEHFNLIKKAVAEYDTHALKVKAGYQYAGTKDIHYPGVSGKTEKLIPLLRQTYGNDMFLYADSNGYYNVKEAIRIGRLLEEYNYSYFEEPVMYDHFEDIKEVADALTIPVANGEQDQSFVHFRWSVPNAGAHHEFKGLDTTIIFECPTSPLKVVDGRIKVSTGPGMGVSIDPDFIKKNESARYHAGSRYCNTLINVSSFVLAPALTLFYVGPTVHNPATP